MTEAAQEAPAKAKRTRTPRVKDNTLAVMKELTGLMGERTKLMNEIRAKRAVIRSKQEEVAQLESSLGDLAREIEWRAGVFGLATQPGEVQQSVALQFNPPPGYPQPVLTQPIFRQPEQPVNNSPINRGHADLGSIV